MRAVLPLPLASQADWAPPPSSWKSTTTVTPWAPEQDAACAGADTTSPAAAVIRTAATRRTTSRGTPLRACSGESEQRRGRLRRGSAPLVAGLLGDAVLLRRPQGRVVVADGAPLPASGVPARWPSAGGSTASRRRRARLRTGLRSGRPNRPGRCCWRWRPRWGRAAEAAVRVLRGLSQRVAAPRASFSLRCPFATAASSTTASAVTSVSAGSPLPQAWSAALLSAVKSSRKKPWPHCCCEQERQRGRGRRRDPPSTDRVRRRSGRWRWRSRRTGGRVLDVLDPALRRSRGDDPLVEPA